MTKLFRRTLPAVSVALIAAATLAVGAGTASAAPTAVGGNCQYTSAEPELEEGNTGIAVEQAQCQLNQNWQGPADINVDGIFGPQTRERTIDFQGCAGLAQDGIIGPQTWAALDYWNANPILSCG